jgi:hypothetical protein
VTRLLNPTELFLDGRGAMLDGGYIYIGTAGTDPTIIGNQLALFWDSALTISAPQPLRTLGGRIVNGANPSRVYFAETDYSFTSKDADGNLVEYISDCTETGAASFQPLDSDLTTIAGQANASFGLGLLELTDEADLQDAAGIGSAGLLAAATAAQFRNNTPSKVLTTDAVWGAAAYVALTPGTNVAVDLSTGINFTLAMGGNYTLTNPTNAKEGQAGNILITQDATGSRTLAYGTAYKSVGGTAPVLSTTANARDLLFYEVIPGGGVVISLAKNVPA